MESTRVTLLRINGIVQREENDFVQQIFCQNYPKRMAPKRKAKAISDDSVVESKDETVEAEEEVVKETKNKKSKVAASSEKSKHISIEFCKSW